MDLKVGDRVKVLKFNCGTRAIRRFQQIRIGYDSILEISSISQFHRLITIKVDDTTVSINRCLFDDLVYEVIER